MRPSRHRPARRVFTLAAIVPLGGLVVLGSAATALCVDCGFGGVGTRASSGEGGPGADGNVDVDAAELDEGGSSVFLSDSGYEDPDADPPLDAGVDGACPPNSFRCDATGSCFTRCTGCTGARFACANKGACVARCSTCVGTTFECLACSGKMATRLAKTTCEADPAACNSPDVGYCDCKALGGCFGAFQICLKVGKELQCRGCGDEETDTKACVGGTIKCNAATASCP